MGSIDPICFYMDPPLISSTYKVHTTYMKEFAHLHVQKLILVAVLSQILNSNGWKGLPMPLLFSGAEQGAPSHTHTHTHTHRLQR